MAAVTFERAVIRFTSCCDETVFLEFLYDGTTDYGTLVVPTNLFPGFSNTCYRVNTYLTGDWSGLNPAPSLAAYFTIVSVDPEAKCTDYTEVCPDCQQKCYTLVNCEGEYFNTTNDLESVVNTYVVIAVDGENSTWFVLENTGACNDPFNNFILDDVGPEPCPCKCYEVTGQFKLLRYIDCNGVLQQTVGPAKFCSQIYPIVNGKLPNYQVTDNGNCIDGLCPEKCYKLTNCDTGEIIYSTLQSLSQYAGTNTVVQIEGYDGCWNVDENTATDCNCITVTIQDSLGVNQYTASLIAPYNGWNRWVFTIGSSNYYIWNSLANPSTNWIISKDSSGIIPGTTYAQSKLNNACPETITNGTLTGWVISNGIPWISVQTEKCPAPCDCPVDVIVVREYPSCQECLPIIAYKLTSCENANDIKYTYQDLSQFVGEYVKLEDCGCFFVELIDYQPTSETTVVVVTSFNTCTECLTQYYMLTDCNNLLDPIYTGTDLSGYLNDIVNVKGCEGCWSIEPVEVPINPVPVTITNTYIGCLECIPTPPCLCNRMTNYSTEQKKYTYIDCTNEEQELILEAGQTSEKICLQAWTLDYPDTDNLEVFGLCELSNTNKIYVCPITIPKRKIKPGYSVPTCDIDKWEKITCKASEILYKEVMRLRYGISNCCPDEDEKWLIKKELIDLAALVDPDYVCSPVQSCGCPPSSCGCGCNTTLKTCNSQ